MSQLPEDVVWLYRGVPRESAEVEEVRAGAEIRPPRPDRVGEYWRHLHHMCNDTETAYTSWTSDRSIAEDAAYDSGEASGLSGAIVIFRVAVQELSDDRLFPGRDDEYEWLIEGTVENVSISESAAAEDEESDG